MAEAIAELPNTRPTFTLDEWRKIFHQAALSWYDKQALSTKKTKVLNQMMTDSSSTPQQQAQAADVVYARGVIAITKDPSAELFPKSQSVSVEEALGDEGILFMINNLTLTANYGAEPVFQEVAKEKDLKWQASLEKPEPSFPRPTFMSTVVKKWEDGAV